MKSSEREEEVNKIRNKLEVKFNKIINILEDNARIEKSIDRSLKLIFWVIVVSVSLFIIYNVKTHSHLFDRTNHSQKTSVITKGNT